LKKQTLCKRIFFKIDYHLDPVEEHIWYALPLKAFLRFYLIVIEILVERTISSMLNAITIIAMISRTRNIIIAFR